MHFDILCQRNAAARRLCITLLTGVLALIYLAASPAYALEWGVNVHDGGSDPEKKGLADRGVGAGGTDLFAPPGDRALSFHDVPKGHWFYAAGAQLQRHNLLKGYPNGYFYSNQRLTRYEFAVAVLRSTAVVKAAITPQETPGRPTLPEQADMGGEGGPPPTPEDLKLLRKLSLEFKAQLVQLGMNWEKMDTSLQKLQDQGLHKELALALAADMPKAEEAKPGIGSRVVKRPNWAYASLKQLCHTKEASQVPEDRVLTRDEYAGLVNRAIDTFLRAERTPDPGGGEQFPQPPPHGLAEVIALHKLIRAFRFEIAPTGRDILAVEHRLTNAEEKRILEEEIIDTKPPVPTTKP
jgi:hypothetical protein